MACFMRFQPGCWPIVFFVGIERKRMKTQIRSIVVKLYVGCRRALYRVRQWQGRPVNFRVSEPITIRLFPEGQIAELLYTSRFERRDLQLVARFLRPGMRVIDIGANIGLYSILADRLVGSGGQVWAFEPSTESSARLHRNLALNGAGSVLTVKLALSDQDGGLLELTRDIGRGDGERFLAAGEARQVVTSREDRDSDVESVRVTTLDHFFHEQLANGVKIDFLKIDIEGGEWLVFQGAPRLLSENYDLVMMFESTPENSLRYGYRQEDLFKLLRDFGFRLYCWNRDRLDWDDEPSRLMKAGNIWATRDRRRLPHWN
jgi:FkbM family methyltransferase